MSVKMCMSIKYSIVFALKRPNIKPVLCTADRVVPHRGVTDGGGQRSDGGDWRVIRDKAGW